MHPTTDASERRTDALLAGGLGALAALVVFVTQPAFGMAWDEGYYYPAFVDVWEWMKLLPRAPGEALSHAGIVAGWSHTNELPPVTKWIGALGVAVAPADGAARLFFVRAPFVLLFGATVAVLFLAARTFAPRPWAALAAGAYLLHPHLSGYGHFATTETPFAFVTALAILTLLRWPGGWGRRTALVVLMALALATKVNGLILVFGVCCWLVLRNVLGTETSRRWRGDLITVALIVVAAPIAALLVWPWMWHETFARLAEYGRFITQERLYGVWYLGEKWVRPPGNLEPVPWHYVPVMAVVCTPVVWLLLALAGAVRETVACVRQRGRECDRTLLFGLLTLGPLLAIMLPGSGKYDSLRLFLPAFVPATLWIASAGPLLERIRAAVGRPWLAPSVAGVVLVLTAAPFLTEGIRYHNVPTRVIGARADFFPFERSVWAEAATPTLFREIEERFPGDEPIRVRPMALHTEVFLIQQEWGTISRRFVFDAEPPYDAHLLHNRKGFWGNAAWWLRTNREPLARWPESAREPIFYLFDGLPPGTHDDPAYLAGS